MYRVEYRTYRAFDNCVWRDDLVAARQVAKKLGRLAHVSGVTIVPDRASSQQDRFVMCSVCDFMCRLSQLPDEFCLDTDEPDNPWVWCSSPDSGSCEYRDNARTAKTESRQPDLFGGAA